MSAVATVHESTARLVLLTHFYYQLSSQNEQLIDAFQLANDLIKSGIDEASFDEKLGFCSLAISGITAFIAEHGASKTDRANELFTLDIEELAYINEVIAEEMDVMSEAVDVKEPTVMLDARSA